MLKQSKKEFDALRSKISTIEVSDSTLETPRSNLLTLETDKEKQASKMQYVVEVLKDIVMPDIREGELASDQPLAIFH